MNCGCGFGRNRSCCCRWKQPEIFQEKKTLFMQRDLTSPRERKEKTVKKKRNKKFGEGDVRMQKKTKKKSKWEKASGEPNCYGRVPLQMERPNFTRFTVFAAYGCAAGCAADFSAWAVSSQLAARSAVELCSWLCSRMCSAHTDRRVRAAPSFH